MTKILLKSTEIERLQNEFLRVGFKKTGRKTFRGLTNDFKGRISSARRELTIKIGPGGARVTDCFYSTIKGLCLPPLLEHVELPAERLLDVKNFDDFFNLILESEKKTYQ